MRSRYALGALAVALVCSVVPAQTIKTGPAVGESIPAFSAPDKDGHLQTLQSVAGPKGTMLVFFRSADW